MGGGGRSAQSGRRRVWHGLTSHPSAAVMKDPAYPPMAAGPILGRFAPKRETPPVSDGDGQRRDAPIRVSLEDFYKSPNWRFATYNSGRA